MGRALLGVGLVVMMVMAAEGAREHYHRKKAKCEMKKYRHCYDVLHKCPKACPQDCEVDCHSCKPICKCDKPGAVCQDPRFIGGDGITFYFHGRKDRDFCLLSDSDLHINAHFIGKRNPGMTRDFTWVQSIAIILADHHRLFVGAHKTAQWDDSVDRLSLIFDDQPIFLPSGEGATWKSTDSSAVTITRSRSTNAITIEADGQFKITATVVPITEEDSAVHGYGVTEDDCMTHLDLGFKFYSLTGDVHGVLGQTYADGYMSKVKIGAQMPIMGGDREFASSGTYATDCVVNRFGNGRLKIVDASAFGDLVCSSGISGSGIVCKK